MSTKIINIDELRKWEDPGDGWYHVEPYGEHGQRVTVPGEEGDTKAITLLLDDEAMTRIASTPLPDTGIIVDKDHLSHDKDKTTEAMGWVKGLAIFIDEDKKSQLAAFIEWSDVGLESIRGKRYKHFSTEYEVSSCEILEDGNVYRPTLLTGLALTNRPNNLGQIPITNRDSGQQHKQIIENNMTKIAERLGLPAEATEDDILLALDGLIKNNDELKDAEAEAVLNSEGLEDLTEEEKEMYKDGLVTNRERTLKIIRNRVNKAKTEGKGRIHNRGTATIRPSGVVLSTTGSERAQAQGIVNRAHEIMSKTNCSYLHAMDLAKKL